MADSGGKGEEQEAAGPSHSNVRRSNTDPTDNMAGPSTSTTEPPPSRGVRFSEDLDRATVSASQRDPPSLTIDTSRTGPLKKSSENARPVSGILSTRGTGSGSQSGQISPLSPKARDRGYSLRRSLFNRSINNQSEGSGSPVEAGNSSDLDAQQDERKGHQKSASGITVASIREDEADDLEIETVGEGSIRIESKTRPAKEKKGLATINLPNYDVWAARTKRKNPVLKSINRVREELFKKVFGPVDIPPSKDGRHIDIDASRKKALMDERTGKEYIGNSIRSSRYTLLNFVPRQLWFQFSKLANFYFLLVSILQMIPGLSTTGNYTTIAPLLVFVAISMGKEGYDDVRRYKLDQAENNRETLVLHAYRPTQQPEEETSARGRWLPKRKAGANAPDEIEMAVSLEGPKHWAPLKWRDVKVGDIVKLGRDDPVPADIVLLHADGPNGIAFIETMALDGETNLKSKQAPTSLAKRCTTVDDIAACRAKVVVEDPNLDLYNFDGRVTVDGETLPLTTNEIVFRGSTLRNTATAIGMVINSGEECKIRMNANKNPRIKAPELQTITNKIVILLVFFVAILALFSTIAYQVWSEKTEDKAFYLKDAHVNVAQIFVGFFILYNTLIPLSLYVSLEIIKIGQMWLFISDVEIYDPVSNTPMVCNTTTILENLGQVDYVFSDKTGTLTDNVMRFRKLSVAGYAWLHDFDLLKEASELEQSRQLEDQSKRNKSKGKGVVRNHMKPRLSTSNQHEPEASKRMSTGRKSSTFSAALSHPEMTRKSSTFSALESTPRRSGSIWRSTARPSRSQAQPEHRTEDLLKFMQHKPHSVFTKKAKFFLLSLALCHTCLPEVQENGDIEFQAASPDELALVRAAQDLGYLVIDRPARSITISLPGEGGRTETYEVLDVIEFSSKRKRMSIIVRFPDGRVCIFCKGADSALMPRLKNASLAIQKKSEVFRRSTNRKSMEAEQALRRMSEHSPRTSFSIPRSSTVISRKSIGQGRPSMASARLKPIRDELDSWLREREQGDVEVASDAKSASLYETPRTSLNRSSFASIDRQSTVGDDLEDMIDEALVLDDAAVFERCFQHIDDFASEGLRTLLFGYRFLDEQEYDGWKKLYLDATTSLVDRQKLIENAGEIIEQNFELAGATAIEDKLQNGVPETIDKLRRANIKIWMLTGDKRETAINIAHSARLCKPFSEIVILDHTTGEVEQRMATTLLDISKGAFAHTVVVVDGQTLSEIDANETLHLLFFDLAVLADSVICCRASPSQKASLVKRVRTKVKKSTTLAIGDGANDIAMILEAHVGIGISGKEGLQAARISDYSIAQFRFLQRVLLVHGRWNYIRTGKYILATFWKELMFYLLQALYQKWAGYTGTSLFESTSLTVFNTLFTSLPVIFLGIFEQDLNASTLLAVPELYVQGQRNEAFNIKKYLAWMFMAVCESMIVYFTMFGLFGESLFTIDDGLLSMGTLCFTASVIFINTKALFLEMHARTFITLIGWVLPVGGWFLWQILLSLIFKQGKSYPLYAIKDGFLKAFGTNLLWWLVLILTLACLMVLELGVSSIRKTFWPTDVDVFQVLQNDAVIRARFEETVRRENGELEGTEVGVMMSKEKASADVDREGEIQELLKRPRVMWHDDDREGEVVRSPVEIEAGHTVSRRKFSVDASNEEGIELAEQAEPKATRQSVDVAELARR